MEILDILQTRLISLTYSLQLSHLFSDIEIGKTDVAFLLARLAREALEFS